MSRDKIKFFKNWNIVITFVLFAIMGFIVYANALKGGFIWDDELLVQDNMVIRGLSKMPDFFTQDISGRQDVHRYGFYRPLTMMTFAIDYASGKSNVEIYHLTSIILHILSAFSIYLLVNLLFRERLISLLTGTLFLIHPVQTEAVTYISGRADLLVSLFIISSLIFYIKYLESKSKRLYGLLLISYVFALLSKENSLIFPAILLLYHYGFRKGFKIREFSPILGLTFLYIFLRFTLLASLLPETDITQWRALFGRVPGFFVAIASYIRILFFPFDLHMEYGNMSFSLYDFRAILGAVISIVLLIYAFRKRNRDALFFFSACWFFIALLPSSSIYPVNAFFMAEHWLYLPSLGFFIIISKWLTDLYSFKKFRMLALFCIFSISAFYSYLSIMQNYYWRDPVIFYTRTLKYGPGIARTYYNFGNAYYRLGNYPEAVAMYKKAIEIKPGYCNAYNNLGNAYYRLGNYPEAVVVFKKIIEIDPGYYRAYNNLGTAYSNLGNYPEAAVVYKKAIEMKPDYAMAYFNLATAYFDTKQYKLSIQYCDGALELGYKVPLHFLRHLAPYRK
jgi:tetratricopeptide (TPR) repeat protein